MSAHETRLTAGDLLLEAVDPWLDHANTCDRDDCDECVTLINRVRVAQKVWKSSQYRRASIEAQTVDRFVEAWGVDPDVGEAGTLTRENCISIALERAKDYPRQFDLTFQRAESAEAERDARTRERDEARHFIERWFADRNLPAPEISSRVLAQLEQIEACAPFLKDGETPAECIERNREDAQATLTLLRDARRTASLFSGPSTSDIADLKARAESAEAEREALRVRVSELETGILKADRKYVPMPNIDETVIRANSIEDAAHAIRAEMGNRPLRDLDGMKLALDIVLDLLPPAESRTTTKETT